MSDVLADIQARIKAPKDKENTFGKYKYRNAESILAAFKEVQPEGVALIMADEMVMVGTRMFLIARVKLIKDGVVIAEATSAAMHATEKKGMDDAQITGACSSYARKYALCGLFAIDDSTDDPDSKAAPPPFDPVAATDRIIAKLQRKTTLADIDDAWKEESDARGAIMDASEAQYNRLKDEAGKAKKALASKAELTKDDTP